MGACAHFLLRVEDDFYNQPESWCEKVIFRSYSKHAEVHSGGRYLASDLIAGSYKGDYYVKFNLESFKEVLLETDIAYSGQLLGWLELKEMGLDIDLFYQTEYFDSCDGHMGSCLIERYLEDGTVKRWK